MLVIIFMYLYKLYWQFMMNVNYRQQWLNDCVSEAHVKFVLRSR
jgi:hypothetical protein